MPFVALNKETRERIDITTIRNPREVLKSGEFVCQLCETPMIIKAGMVIRAHFAHYATCKTEYRSHPESPEHRAAKIFLREKLPTAYAEYKIAKLEYEVPIPEVRRVVDLLATFPSGHKVAHEVQLASITTEELEERTRDYEQAGIDVIWWLGRSANTPANRNWCLSTSGVAFLIDYQAVYDQQHNRG